jgi:hypothetical protein
MPLTITPVAIEKLKADLAQTREEQEQVFRLVAASTGGFRLRLDVRVPGDIVVRHDGTAVLVLDKTLADAVTDAVLDVGQEPDEPDWVLVRGRSSPQ